MTSDSSKQKQNSGEIAVVGMACTFPEAPDVKSFWRNILAHVDCVGDPLESWDADRYLDSGRIYTASGGYLKDLYRFDPKSFGIMPNSVDGGEPDQFLALQIARDALADAGYAADDCDHRDTGVIIGHSTYLHRGQANVLQHHLVTDQTMDFLAQLLPDLSTEQLEALRARMIDQLPQFNADVAPSLVPNVMTGRIANRLNLRGPNYLVDAACSSSLLSVRAAIDELTNHRSRMMIAGGVNASLPAEVTVIFTQLGALSKRGKVRPFEQGSDGTLLGEGLGMVVLKRLEDALADEDRVYAVIRGVGQASDGKGTGLLAPSEDGELLAMQRAYEQADIDPATVSLIEAHGTGIPLGDKTEVAALRGLLGDRDRPMGSVALGSVKSMISHCIPAAGIAGLIKSVLALHHRILPPTLCEEVNPELGIAATPLYVNAEARPWISANTSVRRAGINSFGFGGINTHAILEQAPAEAKTPDTFNRWPAELLVLAASSAAELLASLDSLSGYLQCAPGVELVDLAATLAESVNKGSHRLALVAKDRADLDKKLAQAQERLASSDEMRWNTRSGLSYSSSPLEGKLAFLFPGEGSQYPEMMRELLLQFGCAREWFDFWDSLYAGAPGLKRTDILFPPSSELDEQHRALLEQRLHSMDVGSEAVFIGGQAMFSLLQQFGVQPDAMLGHSSGESSALAASRALGEGSPEYLAHFIQDLNKVYQDVLARDKVPTGVLLAVGALTQDEIAGHLSDDVVIAMENCSNQLVLFGKEPAVAPVEAALTEAGGICMRLPFDRGYHTHWFQEMSDAFRDYYRRCELCAPAVPLYSCASAELFPVAADEVQILAAAQWSNKVKFKDTVEKMFEDGVRYFIEVGPSGNLTAFVSDILAGRDCLAAPTNIRRKSDMEQLLQVVGQLYVNDRVGKLEGLFLGREYRSLDWEQPAPVQAGGMQLDNTLPVLRWRNQDLSPFSRAATGPHSEVAEDGITAPAVQTGAPATGPVETQPAAHFDDAVMAEHFSLMRDFLSQQGEVLQQMTHLQGLEETVDSGYGDFPLLSEIVGHTEQSLHALCSLSVYENCFLRDHILSGPATDSDPELFGLSCVPLMVSLEIMAEAVAALAGRKDLAVIENVNAFGWITLDGAEATLEVTVESVNTAEGQYSAQLLRDGQLLVVGQFGFTQELRLPALAPVSASEAFRWPDEELYTVGMFHGPIFQSVRSIVACDESGIEASLSPVSLDGFLVESEVPPLVINPVLLDALGQVAAYWIAQQVGTDYNCFPSTIERIELYQPCPQNMQGLRFAARQKPLQSDQTGPQAERTWDAECRDALGHPLVRVSNLVNVFFEVPHRFYQCRRSPLNGWMGAPLENPHGEQVLLWHMENFSEQFFTQSGGVFMRILAHAMLSLDEREQWYAESGPVKHRMQWLVGRICLKEAVRCWIYQRAGKLLYPSDIVIVHDSAGAPHVDGWWNGQLIRAPEVSLSHDRYTTVAAVSSEGSWVGVDVEKPGRLQHPDHVMASFTPAEQNLLQNVSEDMLQEKVLRIWCAKEAAAKYFGVGMQGDPSLFEVSFADDSWASGQVLYASSAVGVHLIPQRESIMALASQERFVNQ